MQQSMLKVWTVNGIDQWNIGSPGRIPSVGMDSS